MQPNPAEPPSASPSSEQNAFPLGFLLGFVGLIVLLGVLGVAVLAPVFFSARKGAVSAVCLSNVRKLSAALVQYQLDNNESLPAGESWTLAVSPYLNDLKMLHCPALGSADSEPFGYALNESYAGRRLTPAEPLNNVPIVFESTVIEPNAVAPYRSKPTPGRHTTNSGQGNFVGFADGSARFVKD
ncbi:MAG: hypothetical protein AMXMBFR19_01850 [Chthonomonadaceae bacterium]|uniref:Uncharacterized protein n=1 Tax=Candidatus Nitrosymbiomonas proteolyticus TaxID=2608984 RepID=A0A809R8G7_9BACT|nr:conserved hypothetical protein [Candidatus Nitrosymbiomonas proteolyticus]